MIQTVVQGIGAIVLRVSKAIPHVPSTWQPRCSCRPGYEDDGKGIDGSGCKVQTRTTTTRTKVSEFSLDE
ncbi:hypothetical protein SO802_006815 [Lithocarpus litseifolius]|uniref:Uncharacterized protein n=1 Tax=Lithocarpus litseifolius TaxID=425828 RepID=A0AAW2DLX8_9ROSI